MSRPEARNAINLATVDELDELVGELEVDDELSAVILGGAGGQCFCAGGDLKELRRLTTSDEGLRMSIRMQAILSRWEALPFPSIAAIEGGAYGGGCEIALACDMRICSEGAELGFRQIAFAIMTGWGGATRLLRIAGRATALRLLLTGATVEAEEALRLGLVDEVAPRGEALAAARALAASIAGRSPGAVRGIKRAIHGAEDLSKPEAVAGEARRFAEVWSSPDHRAALEAFFAAKGGPGDGE